VSIIGVVAVGAETEDKSINLNDAWHVSCSARHDMYACLTNECVLMPTTCMQQARGCTLHYYGLTPDVDSDVDCVNQCIAYWTLTRGMH
jgi:hypothetical protein